MQLSICNDTMSLSQTVRPFIEKSVRSSSQVGYPSQIPKYRGILVQIDFTLNVKLTYVHILLLQVPTASYFSIQGNNAMFHPFENIWIRLIMSLLCIQKLHWNPQIRLILTYWFSVRHYGWEIICIIISWNSIIWDVMEIRFRITWCQLTHYQSSQGTTSFTWKLWWTAPLCMPRLIILLIINYKHSLTLCYYHHTTGIQM